MSTEEGTSQHSKSGTEAPEAVAAEHKAAAAALATTADEEVPMAPEQSDEQKAAKRAERDKEADEILATAKKLIDECDYNTAAELLSTVLETKFVARTAQTHCFFFDQPTHTNTAAVVAGDVAGVRSMGSWQWSAVRHISCTARAF